jgi:hypothetical protein
MKKLVFYCILSIFASFFITCKQPFSHDDSALNVPTDVVYSADGKSVTIYLDGSAPASASAKSARSLSRVNAQTGYDCFEVVFYYKADNTGANDIIARGVWEIGAKAGVSGVFRTYNGVDYSSINLDGLPALQGAAVLFAGKKSDQTLLAVGELYAIDDVLVTANPKPLITLSTKKVSFNLNAFSAGAKYMFDAGSNSYKPIGSSFLASQTNNGAISEATTAVKLMGGFGINKSFPLFHLPEGRTIQAQYTIGFHSTSVRNTIADFWKAVIYAGTSAPGGAGTATRLAPKYTDKNTVYPADPLVNYNTTCTVALANNNGTTTGGYFDPIVRFNITTNTLGSGDKKYRFAINFTIPVVALSPNGGPKVQWYIRPGYDQYNEELDDGIGGAGGAIMLGIGEIEKFFTYHLEVTKKPKIQYNAQNTLIFDVTGLEAQIKDNEFTPKLSLNENQVRYFIDFNNNGEYDSNEEITAGFNFGALSAPHGYNVLFENTAVKVGVRWYDTNHDYAPPPNYILQDGYDITFGTVNFSPVVPASNVIVISDWDDYSKADTLITSPGTYLLVFTGSMDIGNKVWNLPAGNFTIMYTAMRPGVVIGREPNASLTIWMTGNSATPTVVEFVYGSWPFTTPIYVGGNMLDSNNLKLNVGGSAESYVASIGGNGEVTWDWDTGRADYLNSTTPWIVVGNQDPGESVTVTIRPGVDNHGNYMEVRNPGLMGP